MSREIHIDKVKDIIYRFNFDNSVVSPGSEFIIENGKNEFVDTFRLYDINKGIIVTPAGYVNGFVYSDTNGGEIYNNPSWQPEMVCFSLNFFGLKKDAVYKLTVIGRSTGINNIVTPDRTLQVTNTSQETLIDKNLSGVDTNNVYTAIFKSLGTEETLFFKVGKIFINDIMVSEIEISEDKEEETEDPNDIMYANKFQTRAYGIFGMREVSSDYKGRYSPISRISGKGLNIVLDKGIGDPKMKDTFVIERDTSNDILDDSFVNMNYNVEINLNKIENPNKDFSGYTILEVKNTLSPTAIKQGFIRFELTNKDGHRVPFKNMDGTFSITVTKIF